MSVSYHLDLAVIPMDEYKQTLKQAELIPSRRLLLEEIDERFSRLRASGIGNLEELLAKTKNAAKTAALAAGTGVPAQYLTILHREAGSLLPSPRNLRDFPGIDSSCVEKLAAVGIRNSKQLFDGAVTRLQRTELAGETGINPAQLLELIKLSDLSRVYGVGPVFARLLYDTGVDSVQAIARCKASALFGRLAEAYLAAGNPRVDFKQRDIEFCISMAKRLPAIEY